MSESAGVARTEQQHQQGCFEKKEEERFQHVKTDETEIIWSLKGNETNIDRCKL